MESKKELEESKKSEGAFSAFEKIDDKDKAAEMFFSEKKLNDKNNKTGSLMKENSQDGNNRVRFNSNQSLKKLAS